MGTEREQMRGLAINTVNLRPDGGEKGQESSNSGIMRESQKEGTFGCTDYDKWMWMTRYVNKSIRGY